MKKVTMPPRTAGVARLTRIVAFISLTLDGVMQAPGRADEDTSGGFRHGGWALPYADEVLTQRVAGESMGRAGGLVLGRRTYEDFYGFWPSQVDNPFSQILTQAVKYVASKTLHQPLPWDNSVLLEGDAAEAVARLREQPGKDLVVLGSGTLLGSLMERNLVDRYILLIHPILLGSGRRLFADGTPLQRLRVVDSVTGSTGVVAVTYDSATG
jgi:dihydrofolate reductase